MERALRQFSAEMNDADVALFYYSGHGVQVGDVNYLDADFGQDRWSAQLGSRYDRVTGR